MATAIIQQFNPVSKHWNTLYEIDADDYDANVPISVNRYNGPYRTLFRGMEEKKVDFSIEPVVEEELEDEQEQEEGVAETATEFNDYRY